MKSRRVDMRLGDWEVLIFHGTLLRDFEEDYRAKVFSALSLFIDIRKCQRIVVYSGVNGRQSA